MLMVKSMFDPGQKCAVKFSAEVTNQGVNLNFIKCFGNAGNGLLKKPLGIAISQNQNSHVYVTDSLNNCIQEYDSDGNYINTIGSGGSGPGQFSQPRGIAACSNGILFVADMGNGRIQKINSAGAMIAEYKAGTDIPTDAEISNIAIGTQIFRTDFKYNQIYIFDGNLNYLATSQGNPAEPFRNLRGISVVPASNGAWAPYKALVIENDRIHAFRIGMDVVRVSAEPPVFDPASTDQPDTRIKFTQTETGLVGIYIWWLGNLRACSANAANIGHWAQQHCVDGKDDAGNALLPGTYTVSILARDQNLVDGHAVESVERDCPVVIHQVPVVTMTGISPAAIVSGHNAVAGYVLSMDGFVKAEVVNASGAVNRTLKNESAEVPGAHSATWDGWMVRATSLRTGITRSASRRMMRTGTGAMRRAFRLRWRTSRRRLWYRRCPMDSRA